MKKSAPKIHHFFTVRFSPFTSSWSSTLNSWEVCPSKVWTWARCTLEMATACSICWAAHQASHNGLRSSSAWSLSWPLQTQGSKSMSATYTPARHFYIILVNSVHARCIERQAVLQGAFVKIGDFIRFKAFLVEFLESRRSWEKQSPQKIARKVDFLSLAFTMHLVCTLLIWHKFKSLCSRNQPHVNLAWQLHKKYLSGIYLPICASHIFTCDSENYTQMLFVNCLLGKSHLSCIRHVFGANFATLTAGL